MCDRTASGVAGRTVLRIALALLMLPALFAEPAAAQIEGVSLGSAEFGPGELVPVWRGDVGTYLEVALPQHLAQTAAGVEIRTTAGVHQPGFEASIERRTVTPSESFLAVSIRASVLPPVGEYRARITYPVSVGEPTDFPIRLLEVGRVTAISHSPAHARLKENALYTFTVTGERLQTATVLPHVFADELTGVQVVSASSSRLEFQARPIKAGSILRLDSRMIADRATPPGIRARAYTGTDERLSAWVVADPVVSPLRTTGFENGQTVAVRGRNLAPDGYDAFVTYKFKYGMTGSGELTQRTDPESVQDGEIRFRAFPDMKPGSVGLLWLPRDQRLDAAMHSLSTFTVSGMTSNGSSIDYVSGLSGNAQSAYRFAPPGMLEVEGRGLVLGGSHPAPTARLGNVPIPVSRAHYDVSGERDRLQIDLSGLPEPMVDELVVEVGDGEVTYEKRLIVALPPRDVRIRNHDGTPARFLWREEQASQAYVLEGSNLCVPAPGGGWYLDGTHRIEGGGTLVAGGSNYPGKFSQANPADPCRRLTFTVKNSVPDGVYSLSFQHPGGTASLGTLAVGDPLLIVRLAPLTTAQTRSGSIVSVTLSDPAPVDLTVRLESTSPLAVPQNVSFAAGERSKSVRVGRIPGARGDGGTVTATVGEGGRGQRASVRVSLGGR